MKTMSMKMKYPSYNQNQLKILSDLVCDDIERLFEIFMIEDYRMLDNMIITSCPIHGGDNNSAFNLYHTGDSYRGNWKCRTHQCEETFKSSIIGFIRGCLSRSKYNWQKPGDQVVSFNEAIEFAKQFTNKDLSEIKVSRKEKEKNNFINAVRYISSDNTAQTEAVKTGITRATIKKTLDIPSKYFISRKFNPNILIKYDIGDCVSSGKEMSNRAVVPIYDMDHEFMIGCSGRATDDSKPKWKHSTGFKAENCLYNFWYAKQHIKDTGIVIVVESPGNVWRLEEAGIHNSVAIFGSSLADKQKMILDISGAMTIVTIMDSDEAGQKAASQIYNKCYRTYNIKNIKIQYSDIAEMTVEQIHSELLPLIKDISQ